MTKAYTWDDTIENDGSDFKLLEPGTYPFEITKLEKEYYNGGAKAPACPRAKLTLKVGVGAESTTVTDSILLYDGAEWRISQFFRSIGAKKHGEKFQMNWDESFIVGKVGQLVIETRKFKGRDGDDVETNSVKTYLDASDVSEPDSW